MNFIIQNIDLIIFTIGMFLVNYTIFFIKTDNKIILQIADYLKNFNIIDMSYYISYLAILGLIIVLILGLKLISICMLLFSSANKVGFELSCFLSSITFLQQRATQVRPLGALVVFSCHCEHLHL